MNIKNHQLTAAAGLIALVAACILAAARWIPDGGGFYQIAVPGFFILAMLAPLALGHLLVRTRTPVCRFGSACPEGRAFHRLLVAMFLIAAGALVALTVSGLAGVSGVPLARWFSVRRCPELCTLLSVRDSASTGFLTHPQATEWRGGTTDLFGFCAPEVSAFAVRRSLPIIAPFSSSGRFGALQWLRLTFRSAWWRWFRSRSAMPCGYQVLRITDGPIVPFSRWPHALPLRRRSLVGYSSPGARGAWSCRPIADAPVGDRRQRLGCSLPAERPLRWFRRFSRWFRIGLAFWRCCLR